MAEYCIKVGSNKYIKDISYIRCPSDGLANGLSMDVPSIHFTSNAIYAEKFIDEDDVSQYISDKKEKYSSTIEKLTYIFDKCVYIVSYMIENPDVLDAEIYLYGIKCYNGNRNPSFTMSDIYKQFGIDLVPKIYFNLLWAAKVSIKNKKTTRKNIERTLSRYENFRFFAGLSDYSLFIRKHSAYIPTTENLISFCKIKNHPDFKVHSKDKKIPCCSCGVSLPDIKYLCLYPIKKSKKGGELNLCAMCIQKMAEVSKPEYEKIPNNVIDIYDKERFLLHL